MFDVKTVEQVMQILEDQFSTYELDIEDVDIKYASGRILAGSVAAGENIPDFNRSTVDGYAVISSDTFGASESMPAQLNLLQEVKMGEKPLFSMQKGQACYIPTGGELPENADSVVMIEYSENYHDGYIYLNKPTAPGNNVIFTGDDTKRGQIILQRGKLLRPQEIGALAAMGYGTVKVYKRLKIGIISTGDEIVDIDESVSDGAKVRDINSYALFSGTLAYGCEPVKYGIVRDNFAVLRDMVSKALEQCDIVLISGGSSVGTRDETYKVIEALGEPGILVHGIAVKPGKPTIIGKVRGKAVIGLPGHPVSAYMIFRIFVSRLIEIIMQKAGMLYNSFEASMKCNYPSNNGREEFLPVKVENVESRLFAAPVFSKSGLITSLVTADGFIHITRGSEGVGQGELVKVIPF